MTDQKYKEEALVAGTDDITVGGERILLPEQEPLDSVILDITKYQAPNYNNPELIEWYYSIKFQITADIEGKGQIYSKNYINPSMHVKSTLFAITKAVGLKFEQGQRFDPLTLKEKKCRVMLVNKEKDGLTYQNIDKVLPPKS